MRGGSQGLFLSDLNWAAFLRGMMPVLSPAFVVDMEVAIVMALGSLVGRAVVKQELCRYVASLAITDADAKADYADAEIDATVVMMP